MDKGIQTYLQPLNGAVLAEEEVARGSDSLARLGLVGAGLASGEVLQCLCRAQDVAGIDVADDRTYVRIGGDSGVGNTGSQAYQHNCQGAHKQPAAVDQHSFHRGLLRKRGSGLGGRSAWPTRKRIQGSQATLPRLLGEICS